MKFLQAKAAVIALSIAKWAFIACEGKYTYLPESFESDFECEPA